MTEDEARRRFILLSVIRFGGVLLAFVAISILMRRWVEPAEPIGYALLAVAVFEVAVLPVLLLRRWRGR